MSELHLIPRTGKDEPRADVIFVHGLGGDPFSTWWHDPDQLKDSWPFWLAEEVPEVQVHSLEYEASPSKWLGPAMPLTDRATNVLTVLETHGIGRRPIVFICHSLGGLLAKQMLRDAEDTSVEGWRAIAAQTKTIVFLATPHAGSDHATWLHRLGTLLRASRAIEDLRAHDAHLRNLNTWYRENAPGLSISTHCFFETYPTRIGMIVSPTSADPGISGVLPRSVDADHVSICKPKSRRDLVYRYVLQRVQERSEIQTDETTSPALKETLSEPLKHGRMQEHLSSIVDFRRQADGWKRFHERCQFLSLKLIIIRGLIDRGHLDQSLHDLETHWSLECSILCKEFAKIDWLPGGSVRNQFLEDDARAKWFPNLIAASVKIDGVIDACVTTDDLARNFDSILHSVRQIEKTLAELLRYLDRKLVLCIQELDLGLEGMRTLFLDQR
jgi:pimeloyl-ACP methyl ester carboxylesterase